MTQHTAHQNHGNQNVKSLFERFSTRITRITGSPGAFLCALTVIIAWGVTGPIFNYSNTWQLVINTGTTIITFLMVFLIQQAQNKDTTALQIKLNELIACNEKASNRLIDVEDLTEEELLVLKKYYVKLSNRSHDHNDLYSSHSLDEAEKMGQIKASIRKRKPK
jgi:low affinity Fe/Cu permease